MNTEKHDISRLVPFLILNVTQTIILIKFNHMFSNVLATKNEIFN